MQSFALHTVLVEATGLEPTTFASRTQRATNCATPRYSLFRYAPQNVLDRKRIYYSKYGADCQIFLLPSGKYLENYFKRGKVQSKSRRGNPSAAALTI